MTYEISDEELDQLDALLQRISPAPWRSFVEGRDFVSGSSCITVGEGTERADDIELLGATEFDQDFIALCRQLVPKLVTEVRRSRR